MTGCECDHCCRHPGNGNVVTVVRSGDKLARCLGLRVVRQGIISVLSIRLYSLGNLFLCVYPPHQPLPTPTTGKRILSRKNVIVGRLEGGVMHRGRLEWD